jgi:antitoxin component YwqK of YwqJK toxin-antitoxin module
MEHTPLTIERTYSWSQKLVRKSYFTDTDHGVLYHFNENGNLASAVVLHHGKKIHSKEWYYNGVLNKKVNWVNSKLHGACRTWDPEGNIQSEVHYKQGKQHGITRRWKKENGKHQLYSIQTYKNDLLHGLQIVYHQKDYANYYFSIDGVDHTGEIKMIVKDIKNITKEELTLIGILYGF